MTLAQRVKDHRYAKGWGPDELANRAEISRTALYQIESGKTEQPRAGTVRRIAAALSVPTETLLGQSDSLGTVRVAWSPILEDGSGLRSRSVISEPGFASGGPRGLASREQEVERKFQELLQSPLGEGLARIVEETHRLLPVNYGVAR